MTDRRDWQSGVGETWAAEWRRTDRSFTNLAQDLDAAILAVAPASGQAVDIGSGAGATAAAVAAALPGLSVLGIDLSSALVDTARRERSGLPNLRFVVGDVASEVAQAAPVDLFFSRHGVMFFNDPVAGFTALRGAARGGAAIVFSCFAARRENEWITLLDSVVGAPPEAPGFAPGPFGFAEPAIVRDVLSRSGWTGASPMRADYRYLAGKGEKNEVAIDDATAFFSRIGPAAPIIAAAPPEERVAITARLRDVLAPHCRDGVVVLDASAWIWTAHAGEAS
ncbi:class I SAM-dependent methyltransferase [Sphingomonas sp. EC-HK361]|uniref:class I SAM-dependent methyltransferase n=1 Tax=Sphingomonas sp. EC-HK361 TaxID=2038397 RepID=UPI0018FECEA2|nr:class I SAM-dependent methyltransferase [Sphingomonas sp. EC-HK361]